MNIKFELGKRNKQPPPEETQGQTTPREGGRNNTLGGSPLAGFYPGGAGNIAMTANPMPQPLGRGAAMATTTRARPYSGFDEALKKWGLGTDMTVLQDLKWQKEVDGDAQKVNLFKEVVKGLQDFQTYILIKPGNAFVTVLH